MDMEKFELDSLVDDIKYLEELGLGADEILDNILSNDAAYYTTKRQRLIKAFKRCGYTVEF